MFRNTIAGILVSGLVFSAIPSPAAPAPDEKLAPPTRAELMKSQNNLKQIALAVINCSDTNRGNMPTDIRSKDGKAHLSWRVAILPYIDEVPLYKQFNLDEAWDSETNKKLVEKLPKVYAPIRVKAKAGETFYQVFSGEKALFGPKANPRFPASITDGTSNTGLCFEAGEPVIWTKPADLPYDEKKDLPKLGGLFDGICHVAMCDGSVIRMKKDPPVDALRALITPSGGEILDIDKLRTK